MNNFFETFLESQEYPLTVAKLLAKPYAVKKFNEHVSKCSRCKNCIKSKQDALWGNPNATLLIVLPQPSSDPTEYEYLLNVLNSFHINLDIVAFTYATQCNFREEQTIMRPPFREDAKNCAPHLKEVLEIIEPLAILCLSTLSSNFFYEQSLDLAMTKPSFIRNIPLYTTYSPAYLLNLFKDNDPQFDNKEERFYNTFSECLKELEKAHPNLLIYKE